MNDSQANKDKPDGKADLAAADVVADNKPADIHPLDAAAADASKIGDIDAPKAAFPHPMSEMTGAASTSSSDATPRPDLSTAQSNAAGPHKTEPHSDAKPSEIKASEPLSTAITILPPIRDFGGRPSDTMGPETTARTWPLTAAQMRQWALAAAAVVMTVGAAGAFAVTGISHFGDSPAAPAKAAASASLAAENAELKQAVSKLGTDVAELRNALDRASKASTSQIGRVVDRVDRMEKAQVEPNARLARLSESVERLGAAPKAQAQPPVQASAQERSTEKTADRGASDKNAATRSSDKSADVTGSVAPPAQAAAAPVGPEPKKPPIVQGWTLREVSDGGALVQGPLGLYDVYPGDPLPGLNRVEAIRREGGRWVVVTRKGWIVAR